MKLVSWMICASLLGSVTVAGPVAAAPPAAPAAGVAARVKTLNALLAEQWQHNLQNSPDRKSVV